MWMWIAILVLAVVGYMYIDKPVVEGYHDITPYEYHWDMFKCYDMDCLKDQSFKCYRWCDNWPEDGGRHNCRLRCLDYADMFAYDVKLNDYTFGGVQPRLEEHSILRDTDYF